MFDLNERIPYLPIHIISESIILKLSRIPSALARFILARVLDLLDRFSSCLHRRQHNGTKLRLAGHGHRSAFPHTSPKAIEILNLRFPRAVSDKI